MVFNEENIVLDEILNFKVKEVPSETRFWMIRTKQGYFYNEFIANRYVALGWNSITISTSLNEDSEETLKQQILIDYPKTKRPKSVINKCNTFINDIKAKDILLIPNNGTTRVAIAFAGNYYEDDKKTLEFEQEMIPLIEHGDASINEILCPYKKRRNIEILKIIDSSELNYHLYRAMTNHHGLSNMDSYAINILSMLFNIFSYDGDVCIRYKVNQPGPISPRALSAILYGTTSFLCDYIEENKISTKVNISSEGDIIVLLRDVFDFLKNNNWILGMLMVIVFGGSALGVKSAGLPKFIKDILMIKPEIKSKELENDAKELDNETKRLDIEMKKIELAKIVQEYNVNADKVEQDFSMIIHSIGPLQIGLIDEIYKGNVEEENNN